MLEQAVDVDLVVYVRIHGHWSQKLDRFILIFSVVDVDEVILLVIFIFTPYSQLVARHTRAARSTPDELHFVPIC